MSRIEELEKRLAADANSRMFVQLAEEYRKAGMLEQAIDVCEQGLKKHPQYPSARVALGRALLEAEHLDRASAEFEAVLKQVPDNILANKFLGETYHRLGRHAEALLKYRVAHSLAPEDTELDEKIAGVEIAMAGGGAPPPPPVPAAKAPLPAATAAPPAPSAVPPVPTVAPSKPEPSPEVHAHEDLAPIPLVQVDEPMILEERSYFPPARPAAPEAAAPRMAPTLAGSDSGYENELEATFIETPATPKMATPSPPPPVKTMPKAVPAPPPVAEIETPTMAEIYASQGHFDRAVDVYQRIVERQPNDTRLRARLEELRMLSNAASPAHRPAAAPSPPAGSSGNERTVRVLEQWLDAIQKSRGA